VLVLVDDVVVVVIVVRHTAMQNPSMYGFVLVNSMGMVVVVVATVVVVVVGRRRTEAHFPHSGQTLAADKRVATSRSTPQ